MNTSITDTKEHRLRRFELGDGPIVEAIQPLGSSLEQQELERFGEGLYSITFQTADLAEASKYLMSKGEKIEMRGDRCWLMSAAGFGLRIALAEEE